MATFAEDAARSMGADRASEDKAPMEPRELAGWDSRQKSAYYEGFVGAAEDWAEQLRDRAAMAEEYAEQVRKEG